MAAGKPAGGKPPKPNKPPGSTGGQPPQPIETDDAKKRLERLRKAQGYWSTRITSPLTMGPYDIFTSSLFGV
jgi:hypothetical protein